MEWVRFETLPVDGAPVLVNMERAKMVEPVVDGVVRIWLSPPFPIPEKDRGDEMEGSVLVRGDVGSLSLALGGKTFP